MHNLGVSRWKRLTDLAMEYALYFLMVGISISNGLTSIGAGAVLLEWVLKKILLREKLAAPRPLVILSGLLFLAYAASLFNSEYLPQSLRALFFKTGKYLLLMLAIADGVKEKRVAIRMGLVLCLTAAFVCWDGFYQFFSGRDLLLFREAGRLDVFYKGWEFHSFRVTGPFPAANTFASYLVPVLMLGLALSFLRLPSKTPSPLSSPPPPRGRGKGEGNSWNIAWGKGICLGSMVLGLLLTFSRGGLVACLGGVLMLAVLLKKKILWIIPIVFLVAFLFGKNLYGNRAAKEGALDPTVETRLVMLRDATRMFQSHPWTGIGLNTYYKTHEKSHSLAIPPSYAHNSYIQMIAEVGIVGFISFMALLIYWFGRGMRSFRRSQDPELKFLLGGVLAGVFGLCTASFFDNVLFELLPVTFFWVLMGYGIALTKSRSENGVL